MNSSLTSSDSLVAIPCIQPPHLSDGHWLSFVCWESSPTKSINIEAGLNRQGICALRQGLCFGGGGKAIGSRSLRRARCFLTAEGWRPNVHTLGSWHSFLLPGHSSCFSSTDMSFPPLTNGKNTAKTISCKLAFAKWFKSRKGWKK